MNRRASLATAVVLAVLTAGVVVSQCGGGSPSAPTSSAASTPPAASAAPSAPPVATPECNASLWNHVHDPVRLQMIDACRTVTGTVADQYASDDGDIDLGVVVDPPYASLLNGANQTKLSGHLQTEAICQSKVHSDVPDALRACQNFQGSVLIPPIGAHVQVTGSYTLDKDHGWMEIHPITVLTIIP